MFQRMLSVAALSVLMLLAPSSRSQDPDVIHIGIVDSLIKELSPGRRKLLDTEFPEMVREFTGLKSDVIQGGEPLVAGKSLAEGKWHLGVFQGIEFAWAHAENAKVQPLMLAVNRDRTVFAVLVAKKDSAIGGFADLKGKDVHIQDGRAHCRLFTEKNAGGDASKFFNKVLPTSNSEAALDALLLDKVHGAVVDAAALQNYEDIQPGRFRKLKVLTKSEAFPPMVIAYGQGILSDELLEKFKNGMFTANKSEKGRDAMGNMKITAFEPVGPDDLALMREIVKAYPAPKR